MRINGRDHYLGKYDSSESYERYDRLVAEWLLTRKHGNTSTVGSPGNSTPAPSLAVNDLILAF